MMCLLDTHSFLWSAFTPRRLSKSARAAILDPENDVAVSAVTFWEISLKHGLGKITLEGIGPENMPDTARRMGYELVALSSDDAASFHQLPRGEHRDPFDRMLAWQAISRRWTLVSRDSAFTAYRPNGLKVLW
jgi:PIN domain nuclease of toxin-antitoxin system